MCFLVSTFQMPTNTSRLPPDFLDVSSTCCKHQKDFPDFSGHKETMAFPISVDQCSEASVIHFSGIGYLKIWQKGASILHQPIGVNTLPQFHIANWKPWPIYFNDLYTFLLMVIFPLRKLLVMARGYFPFIFHSIPKKINPHFRRVTSSFPMIFP